MKNPAGAYIKIITPLLILLWVYTGSSKLMNLNEFRAQLALQNLPAWSKPLLLYTLPEFEITVAFLLLFRKTELVGFWASMILMLLFTVYVGLAISGGFTHVPCSCGGVLKTMGWKVHYFFNLFFLALTSISLIIHYKKGGAGRI